jgi:hypothetical protein
MTWLLLLLFGWLARLFQWADQRWPKPSSTKGKEERARENERFYLVGGH